MTQRLQHALEALYGLERRKDKLGLDGTRSLMAALGDPHTRFRSVHVAGTNGKGSVCALVERALREAGHRTGLFTSPHLVDFRERIRVNGRWADGAWLERALERITSLPEGKDRTFFEVCTALAFLYFAERGVEWAVVEVGLGGRLDCTNVLQPEVCAITSIDMDHSEILGDTLEKIAAEKAGILKPGVPVVVGGLYVDAGHLEALRVIQEHAGRVGAPVRFPSGAGTQDSRIRGESIETRHTLSGTPWGDLMPRVGSYASLMLSNTITALGVLTALDEGALRLPQGAVRRGLASARWPGRLERCPTQPRLWWDGAHNPAAFDRLSWAWIDAHGMRRPEAVVLALSRDKDAAAILDIVKERFFPQCRLLIASRTHSERAREPNDLAELADARGIPVQTARDVRTATESALDLAGDGVVLLTGSLFAVGEAMEAFGGAPGEFL